MGTCAVIKQCYNTTIDIPTTVSPKSHKKSNIKDSVKRVQSKKELKVEIDDQEMPTDDINSSLSLSLTKKSTKKRFCSSKINRRYKIDDEPRKKPRLTNKYIVQEELKTESDLKTDIKLSEDLRNDQLALIRKVLKDNEIVNEFDDDTFEEFIIGFFTFELPKDHVIFTEGDDAKVFYIVQEGTVALSSKNTRVTNDIMNDDDNDMDNDMQKYNRVCSCRDFFGLEAFEENSLRLQTAITNEKTILLCVSGNFYQNAFVYMDMKLSIEKIDIIKEVPLFQNIEHSKQIVLSKLLSQALYKPNSIVINENERQDRLFIIQKGIIRMTRKFKKIQTLGKGDIFGQIGLFMKNACYYTYSVDKDDLVLYELPYNTINEVLGSSYIDDILYELFKKSILQSERSNDILYQHCSELFHIFKLAYYERGSIVFSTDAKKNKKICVIISGQLLKSNSKREIVAKTGDLYGHHIVDCKQDTDSNIISEEESLVLEAKWDIIVKESELYASNTCLGETVNKLKRIPIFSSLKETQYVELAKNISLITFKDADIITREGENADRFYIIKSGKVKMHKQGAFIRDLDIGGCFGEIPSLTGEIKLFTTYAVENTECYVLTKEDFRTFDYQLTHKLKTFSSLNDIKIELNQLYYIKTLGNGQFGKVYLAHNHKHFYAIKYAKLKTICQKRTLMKYYLNEKNIMLQLDHPFIIRLVKTLKTSDYLFFLMEYVDGIPLKQYLDKRRKNKQKNLFEPEFYGAILLHIIHYLHGKRILHRDIKPDNCMIDKTGYLKLIDFGIAKDIKNQESTMTICGTPHYLAPEVITEKGYSFSSDYWSIGVTMFEIFYGYVPFGQSAKDPMGIYYEILNKKLTLPNDIEFTDINSFFRTILSKNQIHRACNYQLLKRHPFFHQFDFEQLTSFTIVPPYVPESYIEQNGNVISTCRTLITKHMEMNNQGYQEEINESDIAYLKEIKFFEEF